MHFGNSPASVPRGAKGCDSSAVTKRAPSPAPPCSLIEAGSVPGHLEIVQDRRTRIEGHARGPGCARVIAGAVPAALGGGHHIARIADKVRLTFHLHAEDRKS